MPRPLRVLALAPLIAASLLAVSPQVSGEPREFPVTNTRYRSVGAAPMLRSNGSDFFLFWQGDQAVRATKLVDGENRPGHVIFSALCCEPGTRRVSSYDVARSGTHFLAAAAYQDQYRPPSIATRLLDADAQPAGEQRVVATNAKDPRLAAGKDSALLVYTVPLAGVHVQLLTPDGRPAGSSKAMGSFAHRFDVASNGTRFAVIRDEFDGIAITIHDGQGQALHENRIVIARTGIARDIGIASDGTGFVVVWSDEVQVAAAHVNADGVYESPFVIDEGPSLRLRNADVVWNLTGWSVSYTTCSCINDRIRVAHLDRSVRRVVKREETGTGLYTPSLAAAANGSLMLSWRRIAEPFELQATSVARLPLAGHEPREATIAAAEQHLLATASSAEATLLVWREHSSAGYAVRAGVRSHQGNWSEREIFAGYANAAAASSDGRHFAVALGEGSNVHVLRLDDAGAVLGSPISFIPKMRASLAMAWNGTNYAVVSASEGRLLTPAGTLSPAVDLPSTMNGDLALASDGSGFLLTGEVIRCQFLFCHTESIRGIRLGPQLQRLDSNGIVFSEAGDEELAGVVWNDTEYVAMWAGDTGGIARVAPAAGGAVGFDRRFNPGGAESPSLTRTSDGRLAVAVPGAFDESSDDSVSVVMFFDPDGTWTGQPFDRNVILTSSPRLEPLPDGAVAYISASVRDEAPLHAASHVMMGIAAPQAIAPPGSPSANLVLDGARMRVTWTPPAGQVNGYRVELRIDGGAWIELEPWFASHELIANVKRPSWGSHFAARVRAFNDAGAGAYSNIATTDPKKRQRAARH